jgi:hypothetical protein
MSTTRRFFIATAALAAWPGRSALAAAQPGLPAPDFTNAAADGRSISLSSLRGRTVVLEWTNHQCPFVVKHYDSGNIPALQRDAAAQGVVWLQVISSAPGQQGHVDGPTAIKLNAERHATPAHTLLDPEGRLGRAYGARTTPQLFIVNTQGVLVYAGGIDSIASARQSDIASAEPYVRLALAELAAGKPVSRPLTRPYGCSVKYGDA